MIELVIGKSPDDALHLADGAVVDSFDGFDTVSACVRGLEGIQVQVAGDVDDRDLEVGDV